MNLKQNLEKQDDYFGRTYVFRLGLRKDRFTNLVNNRNSELELARRNHMNLVKKNFQFYLNTNE